MSILYLSSFGLVVAVASIFAIVLDFDTVQASSPPWELSLRDPYLSATTFGSEILRGHKTTLQSQVINNVAQHVQFVYILQMKDENDIVVEIAVTERNVEPGNISLIDIDWTPRSHQKYSIDIFLWTDLEGPSALASPAKMKISVA